MNTLHNNIIITATNSPYFDSLLTLIASIHRLNIDLVDKIFVHNLGLEASEINQLKKLQKIEVLEFSDIDKNSHPKFMEPKSYVYKIHCMKFAQKLGQNILWIDSGAMFLRSCDSIFNTIKLDDIFLVGDIHRNKDYTHDDCIKHTSATPKELNDTQLWAGLVGYKANGRCQHIIDEAYKYAMIPGCLDGNQQNHRHDQSILSILASRYSIPKQDIDIYGYWTDQNRNLQSAIQHKSIVFAHRRGHRDHNGLIYEN